MIAAIRSDTGISRRLLDAALQEQLILLVSVPLMIEYQAVMTRPEHLEASGLTMKDVDLLLDFMASIAVRVRLAFLWRPTLRDSDDDMVLETAINGGADAIVTFNLSDFRGEATRRFGMEILSPGEAWRRLENRK